ncbi:MAG: hypothetical protein WBE68_08195 [Candidatus Nitrosopolaris sp.]
MRFYHKAIIDENGWSKLWYLTYRITGTQFPLNNTPSSTVQLYFSISFGRGILISSIIIGIMNKINNKAMILVFVSIVI